MAVMIITIIIRMAMVGMGLVVVFHQAVTVITPASVRMVAEVRRRK